MLIMQSLFFINFYANKNVLSGITTTYMLQLIFFLFQLIFVFPLFLGMVMCANEFETKENQKLTEIKIYCNIYKLMVLKQQPIISYYKRL